MHAYIHIISGNSLWRSQNHQRWWIRCHCPRHSQCCWWDQTCSVCHCCWIGQVMSCELMGRCCCEEHDTWCYGCVGVVVALHPPPSDPRAASTALLDLGLPWLVRKWISLCPFTQLACVWCSSVKKWSSLL